MNILPMNILSNLDRFYKTQGGSLAWDDPTYVERKADRDFYEKLKQGDFCYVFNARQTGKSSLKNRTIYKLTQAGIDCADIDLTGIGGSEEECYRSIINELVYCFNLKINQRDWWKKHQDYAFNYRFTLFLKEVLLAKSSKSIVIFIDEIDSILSLNFQSDNFFALIRSYHNKRANISEYKRLTFALLGVATPSDLIQDKYRTPFNIGHAIELTGFSFEEAQSKLIQGLEKKVDNPKTILKIILKWTNGQPFLTQKLCSLVVKKAENGNPDIDQLVEQFILNNWESQDEPEHLKTIQNRLLKDESKIDRLLAVYTQILKQGEIKRDGSPTQAELRLSGLITKNQGNLEITNLIYKKIFNLEWVEEQLNNLWPYTEETTNWRADKENSSYLLHGEELEKALKWSKDKTLKAEDGIFLRESAIRHQLEYQRLEGKFTDPDVLLNSVYGWTNGQKDLKDKIFSLILTSSKRLEIQDERNWVTELVRSHLIDRWKTHDDAGHLREIRDRILKIEESDRFWMLILYRRILQNEEVGVNEKDNDQLYLLDLGLVVKRSKKLIIANRIYQEVFNSAWVETIFPDVRSYSKQLAAWFGSEEQDSSQLLHGQELKDTLKYIENQYSL
ncbi:AAA-like domain-containing protein, partial [Spirulina sp. 06S082]|uniref:AAA-like domain-containing protein n=1 Tax=Spirulina sp. 06S082 TaxID=3110248 RepID=UPI002B21EA46